jgi:hypothetical protein
MLLHLIAISQPHQIFCMARVEDHLADQQVLTRHVGLLWPNFSSIKNFELCNVIIHPECLGSTGCSFTTRSLSTEGFDS